ncbi:MAG: hypothetical protein DMD79_21980 [Candidatus Rokuibacteriota bacterium]|nr:MAG: hypothetical protein DMD79_21980 [Candidatus Rokubacteria bacterium]
MARRARERVTPTPGTRLLVLVALEYEARAIRRRVAAPGALDLSIQVVGVGATRLSGLERRLAAERPAAVLVTGVAGGLAPDVHPGDLVVAREVGPVAGGRWLNADARLVERSLLAAREAGTPCRVGRLLTASGVVPTPTLKAENWRRHAALAVDMESAPALAWAARAALPAFAVRAVADGPGDTLPLALAAALGAEGGVRPGAVLGWVGRPAVLAAAWRVWRRSRLAMDRLGRFLVAFTRCPLDP